MAGMFYFLVLPALYGCLVYLEYTMNGFDRFLARAAGEGYNMTDDDGEGLHVERMLAVYVCFYRS